MEDFDMDVVDADDAERSVGFAGGRGRTSKYEPIAQKWEETEDGDALMLSELESNDIQNLRNLMYRRFGKENVIVRSAQQEDETYKAVIRTREDGEYLRNDDEE